MFRIHLKYNFQKYTEDFQPWFAYILGKDTGNHGRMGIHPLKRGIDPVVLIVHCDNKFIHFFQVDVVYRSQPCPKYFKEYCKNEVRLDLRCFWMPSPISNQFDSFLKFEG